MIRDYGEPQALILGPLSSQYEDLRKIIAEALRGIGVTPVRVEDLLQAGESWRSAVLVAIERSELIIALVTGTNPNVMYEVGFAHGRRRPLLFIMDSDVKQVPPYIEGYLFLVYDRSNVEGLSQNIKAWALRHLPQPVSGS